MAGQAKLQDAVTSRREKDCSRLIVSRSSNAPGEVSCLQWARACFLPCLVLHLAATCSHPSFQRPGRRGIHLLAILLAFPLAVVVNACLHQPKLPLSSTTAATWSIRRAGLLCAQSNHNRIHLIVFTMAHSHMHMDTRSWLNQPVMLHSDRTYSCSLDTKEQCEWQVGYWRFWYGRVPPLSDTFPVPNPLQQV